MYKGGHADKTNLEILADFGVNIQTNKSGLLKTGLCKVNEKLGKGGRKKQPLAIWLQAVKFRLH